MIRAISRKLAEVDIDFSSQSRRLRCIGHVINLSVKSFWFGEDVTSRELQEDLIISNQAMANWRRIGPWGKAHNITVFIRSSVKRRKELQQLGAETILKVGNATRWNSGLNMIQSLIRNRTAVDFFCARYTELEKDKLSDSDWLELDDAAQILQPFLVSTVKLEGTGPSLWEVIPEIDYLCGIYR
jgi:hypothetical protein